jgi:hypothetical protein
LTLVYRARLKPPRRWIAWHRKSGCYSVGAEDHGRPFSGRTRD